MALRVLRIKTNIKRGKRCKSMETNANLTCAICEKLLESPSPAWYAFDIQHSKVRLSFCSAACLSSWVKKKQTAMVITVVLGILLTVLMMSELGGSSFILLFIPYMLRQVGGRLKRIASTGWIGEFVAFAVILLGSLTIIYPAFVLMQEIKEYLRIREVLHKS